MSAQQLLEGKSAGSAELRLRLARAGVEYLQGAVQNPSFGEIHLEIILSNPMLPSGLIQGIASQKQWLVLYEVRRGIVAHRNAARALKLNLLHFLRWRDLVRVIEDRHQPLAVHRAAETLLRKRIDEMSVGEKIALARIAGPAVFGALRADLHPDVIGALLVNPRLVEEEVLAICSEERASPAALAAVGACGRWSSRHPVKMALVRNPQTPTKVCLGFLDSLPGMDLKEVIAAPSTSRLLRATARQILKSRESFVDRKKVVS
ncbi:MAG TPA: hypothetical protein VGR38_00410 [Candidatus Polarisedimenticolia bacterium]|jgi:hypothetical protein|nr:hypothetical protein [Candidatus Polarisedimenticolia bacterium]